MGLERVHQDDGALRSCTAFIVHHATVMDLFHRLPHGILAVPSFVAQGIGAGVDLPRT